MINTIIDYILDNYVLLFIVIGMVVMTDMANRTKQEQNRTLRWMLAVIFALSITDFAEYRYSLLPEFHIGRMIVAVIGYWLRPIFGLFSIYAFEKKRKRRLMLWIPVVVNGLIYTTAFFSPICIYYTAENVFSRGPLYPTVFVAALLYAILFLYYTSRVFQRGYLWEGVIQILGILAIAVSSVIDAMSPRNRLMFPSMAVVVMFYYIYLQMQQKKVRELQREIEATIQQEQLMMSQIQPHFLYNTLATAAYLCTADPELAEHTIQQFANYLRQNMSVIGSKDPIPFQKELDHTRIYTDIEMLRFDNIDVVYDLEDTDFMIPPLSVQPMVENAIRHGVRSRKRGVVTVRSFRMDDMHVVEIEDNGIGFDTEATPSNDRPHIGLNNVNARIKSMMKGYMTVESEHDVGTKITMYIPAKRG